MIEYLILKFLSSANLGPMEELFPANSSSVEAPNNFGFEEAGLIQSKHKWGGSALSSDWSLTGHFWLAVTDDIDDIFASLDKFPRT